MPTTLDDRLTTDAALAVLHGAVVVGALTGAAGSAGAVAVLVVSVPLFFAWGRYQADVALNPLLEERDRARWRTLLWLVPWSMTLYWHRFVRPRRGRAR